MAKKNRITGGPWLGGRYAYHNLTPDGLNHQQASERKNVLQKIGDGTYRQFSRACALCGSDDHLLLAGTERYRLPIDTVICKSCGFMFSNPCLTSESFADFYDQHYRRLYSGREFADQDFFDYQANTGRYIYNFLDNAGLLGDLPPGGLVLEVGAGAGGILKPFHDAGFRVLGLDLGSQYLEFGRSQGLDLRQGALSSLDQGIEADLIIYSQVLEHIVDLEDELAAIRRRLSPSGRLFVSVPGILDCGRNYGGDLLSYLQMPHVSHFCLDTLTSLMAAHGFELGPSNERIWAAFVKGDASRRPAPVYERTLAYIARMHRLRHLYRLYHRMYARKEGAKAALARLVMGTPLGKSLKKLRS